jgi:uncharacterized protein with NAD-binding domain and iron-sulfur cluster
MAGKRVAILGGGLGGLATAWQLTRDPGWQAQVASVTVYQMGWRLGGKCATGRGVMGRVEEHGIHLFGGGYYNALPMLREVYHARYGADIGEAEFNRRVERQYTSVSVGPGGKQALRFPPSPLTLDQAGQVDALLRGNGPLTLLLQGLRARLAGAQAAPDLLLSTALAAVDALIHELSTQAAAATLAATTSLSLLGRLAGLDPDSPARAAQRGLLGHWLQPPPWLQTLNLLVALTSGWLADIASGHETFASLDRFNYADWLTRHGAWPSTLQLGVVQAPIGILYQYRGGDNSTPANASLGAGGFLHWLLRTVAYLEAPFWFFRDGTGDTVIAPLYEVLAARGVRFEFFRKVEQLQLSADRSRVAGVRLRVQATTPGNQPYQPLNAAGQWPDRPLFGQLDQGDALSRLPPDTTESYWSDYRADQTQTLHDGADYDALVLAISLGALPMVAGELIAAQPAWRDMVDHVKTIETQSLQLWFDRSSEALGVNQHINRPIAVDDSGLGTGYGTPYDGFCDLSLLLPGERWPAGRQPQALWYFSDVAAGAPDVAPLADATYPARRRQAAFDQGQRFVERELGQLLSSFSAGFDYSQLVPHDPATATTNEQRLAQQVLRANYEPTERYVQALADTTRYRLDAGQSAHFANLCLAGDWTCNGLNVGCVEATVMSGKLAANSLLGCGYTDGVVGYFAR